MPKYSIIVPVYNMSGLLPKCVESLMRQNYDDLEVILVDDCSTDNSYQICLEAAKKDKRFQAVQQDRNRGLSSTRNLGMQFARGKYVTFVDSDDYVEESFIRSIDEKEQEYPYDMITWGMYSDTVFEDGCIEIKESSLNCPDERSVTEATEEDWKALMMNTFFASTCLRFYRLDIIRKNRLEFDTVCVDFEDYVFNITYCRYIHSYLIMKEAFYHYRQPFGQLATLKRKWGTVVPFDVSERVFRATEGFFRDVEPRNVETKEIYCYVYKAYWNEIEYAYRSKNYSGFAKTVVGLVDNQSFYSMLGELSDSNVGRFTRLLRRLIDLRLKRMFGLVLWIMEYRSLGRVK